MAAGRPVVLLAYEAGYGLGHISRLATVATALRRRGIESVLSTFRLDDTDPFAHAFAGIVQGPVWPSYFSQERSLLTRLGNGFAFALTNMGFEVPRYVASNQRAWHAIFDYVKPCAVVTDYAPSAILAAKGRCPSFQVGGPFTTPAIVDGVFPSIFADQPSSGAREAAVLASIGEAMTTLGRAAPANLQDAVIGDESLPMAFAELDPYLQHRREPLLLPDIARPPPVERGRGETVFVYLPEWMQHNDVLMGTICALRRPVRLFMPNIGDDLAADLSNHRIERASQPFSVGELARSARIFVHHGGLGSTQLGLLSGVPQVAVHSDLEKYVDANALVTLKVGRSVDYNRITLPRLRQEIFDLYDDEAAQQRASEVAAEMRARLTGPSSLDILVERVCAKLA